MSTRASAKQTTKTSTKTPMKVSAKAPAGRAVGRLAAERAAAGAAKAADELLTLDRAREELGLEYDEFGVALQIGEVRTVVCGPALWKVPRSEVDRHLTGRPGGVPGSTPDGAPDGLRDRLRLVSSGGAAEIMGVSRDRFVLFARDGRIRPVRWYVNQYRAVVWLYLAREAADFADRNPGLLKGRLPAELREIAEDGRDLRARGWRERRAGQLLRDAYDAWDEASVWAALLGPESVADAVPDPAERAHLHTLRAALPPGRPGRATLQDVREITTADHPDEIAHAQLALTDALSRARAQRPAARPGDAASASLLSRAAPPDPRLDDEPAGVSPAAPRRAELPPSTPANSPCGGVPPEAPPTRPVARAGGAGRRLRGLLFGRREVTGPPGRHRAQSSPTSVSRMTARASSSEAARSTSAEMPQP